MVTSTVTPDCDSVSISRQNWRRDNGSTPPVGSSRKRIAGSCRIAHPSASRCRQPPARSRASVFSRPARPAISITKRAPLGELRRAQPVDAAEERDVLVDGQQLVEREPLRHVADSALDAFGIAGRRRRRRPAPCPRSVPAGRTTCGWSSTCRRRYSRESRRSPRARRRRSCRRRRRTGRTAASGGERRWRYRPRARSSRACASRTSATARVRSSSACRRANCASRTSVLVATPCVVPLLDDALALGRRLDAIVGRRDRLAAGVELQRSGADFEGDLAIEIVDARLQGRGVGERFAMLGGAAAAVPERPRQVDRRVPRGSSSRRCAGRYAGSAARSRSRRRRRFAAARWRRRRRRGNRREMARCSSACRSGRAFSAAAIRSAVALPAVDGSGTVLSALGVAVAASLPVRRRRSASATPRWLAASRASSRWCDNCASADDRSLGGIRPDASRARTSLTCAVTASSDRCEHRFGLTGRHHRPERAGDLEAQVGAGGVEVLRDRAALGARRTLERVGPAAGVDRPLRDRCGCGSCRGCRDTPPAAAARSTWGSRTRGRDWCGCIPPAAPGADDRRPPVPRSRSRRLPRAPRAPPAGDCWRAPGQSPPPA